MHKKSIKLKLFNIIELLFAAQLLKNLPKQASFVDRWLLIEEKTVKQKFINTF